MATTTAPTVENPKNPADLNSAPPAAENASRILPEQSSGGDGDESKEKPAATEAKPADADEGAAATDIQKKMKRAERFGMPVHLSEQEKRNSRAERFGTASGHEVSDSSKQSEELKRKARAERFGIVKSAPADEEAKKNEEAKKKKARLARFGGPSSTDPAEEEKKKARALRFAQPDSSSKANGNSNTGVKTVIAEKAGGGT